MWRICCFYFHGHGGNTNFVSRSIDIQNYYKDALFIFMQGFQRKRTIQNLWFKLVMLVTNFQNNHYRILHILSENISKITLNKDNKLLIFNRLRLFFKYLGALIRPPLPLFLLMASAPLSHQQKRAPFRSGRNSGLKQNEL